MPMKGPVPKEYIALYNAILHRVNRFLLECQYADVESLNLKQNPEYIDIAAKLGVVAEILFDLIDDYDPHKAYNVVDYVHYMKMMSLAIKAKDQVTLDRLAEELDGRSFL